MINDQFHLQAVSRTTQLTFISPPHYVATTFFATLALLNLIVTAPRLTANSWESALGIGCFILLTLITLLAARCRTQLTVRPATRSLFVRWGCRWAELHRVIPFHEIRSIRLTLTGTPTRPKALIEIVCQSSDIECPLTPYPRQQALYLAVTTGARFIKIYSDERIPSPQIPRRF